jgi:peptidoglycan/LPS O-acetylase OafA/YrhL
MTPSRLDTALTPGRRISSLDGLRALAVLIVFVAHAAHEGRLAGYVGVEVFFVLSGYLITGLLLREHDTTDDISLRRFYIRRLLRLYPALIVMVIGATVLAEHYHWGRPRWDAPAALFYVTDFYNDFHDYFSPFLHTWSLAVEEQFYLVWPALLIAALSRGWSLPRLIIRVVVTSVAVTTLVGLAHIGHADRVQHLPFPHIVELASGAWLAIALRDGKNDLIRSLCSLPITVVALGALFVGVAVLRSVWWAFPLVVLASWPPVAHLVTAPDSPVTRAFAWRPAVWLGERSYAFYLWHYPILVTVFAENPMHSRVANATVAGLIVLVVITMSWRFVEQPFLRLKERFEPKMVVGPTQ